MILLAVDIGNTDLKFGIFKNGELINQWRASGTRTNPEKFSALLRDSLARVGMGFNAVIYSSVVPEIETSFKKTLHYCFNIPESAIFTVTHQTRNLPVDFSIYPSGQLGMDRLVNACGAALQYPEKNIVVVDFGTATTFDLVNNEACYLGGSITPGFQTFASILSVKTSQLPEVSWQPGEIQPIEMGRSTEECMKAGLALGYRGIIKELLQTAETSFGERPRVIATGGLAKPIINLCSLAEYFDEEDPMLTLRGLYGLFQNFQRSREQRQLEQQAMEEVRREQERVEAEERRRAEEKAREHARLLALAKEEERRRQKVLEVEQAKMSAHTPNLRVVRDIKPRSQNS